MKRLLLVLAAVGLLSGLGIVLRPVTVSGQDANLCYMLERGAYSPGAVDTAPDGQAYRCSFTFDSSLRPTGVAGSR